MKLQENARNTTASRGDHSLAATAGGAATLETRHHSSSRAGPQVRDRPITSSERSSSSSSSISSIRSSSCSRRRRSCNHQHVRFDLSIAAVGTYPAVPRELVPELHWSRAELHRIRAEQRLLAQTHLRANPSLVTGIYCLHGLDLPASSSSRHQNKNKLNGQDDGSDDADDGSDSNEDDVKVESAKRMLAESHSRGLEAFLTPLIDQHRRWAVRQVLSQQDQHKQRSQHAAATGAAAAAAPAPLQPHVDSCCEAESEPPPQQQHQQPLPLDAFLSVCSEMVSETAKKFAQQIAQGDEQAVRRMMMADRHTSNSDQNNSDQNNGDRQNSAKCTAPAANPDQCRKQRRRAGGVGEMPPLTTSTRGNSS